MSLAYRDPKTGRFISKGSAARRTKNLPTTERYRFKKGKPERIDFQDGFVKTQKKFKSNIRDVLKNVGFLKTDVAVIFKENPNLSLDEAFDIALEEGFDIDLEEFELGMNLDVDLEEYLSAA